jgi:hypothetical protein
MGRVGCLVLLGLEAVPVRSLVAVAACITATSQGCMPSTTPAPAWPVQWAVAALLPLQGLNTWCSM